MYTKPLTHQSVTTHDLSADLSALNRLFVAAAISPRFCAGLLQDPATTVRKGFGGEKFHISETTMSVLTSIRVATLPEFIQQLDKSLSNQLLTAKIL
jgi:hypothetical protein